MNSIYSSIRKKGKAETLSYFNRISRHLNIFDETLLSKGSISDNATSIKVIIVPLGSC